MNIFIRKAVLGSFSLLFFGAYSCMNSADHPKGKTPNIPITNSEIINPSDTTSTTVEVPEKPIVSEDTLKTEIPILQDTISTEIPILQDTISTEIPILQDTISTEIPILQDTISNTPIVQDTVITETPTSEAKEIVTIKALALKDKKNLYTFAEEKNYDFLSNNLLSILADLYHDLSLENIDLSQIVLDHQNDVDFNIKELYENPSQANTLKSYIRLLSIAEFLTETCEIKEAVKPLFKNYIVYISKRLLLKKNKHSSVGISKSDKKKRMEDFTRNIMAKNQVYKAISGEEHLGLSFEKGTKAIKNFKKLNKVRLNDFVRFLEEH